MEAVRWVDGNTAFNSCGYLIHSKSYSVPSQVCTVTGVMLFVGFIVLRVLPLPVIGYWVLKGQCVCVCVRARARMCVRAHVCVFACVWMCEC